MSVLMNESSFPLQVSLFLSPITSAPSLSLSLESRNHELLVQFIELTHHERERNEGTNAIKEEDSFSVLSSPLLLSGN